MKIIFFLQDDYKWKKVNEQKILEKINAISKRTKNFTLLFDNEKFFLCIKDFSEKLKVLNGKVDIKKVIVILDEFEKLIENSNLLVIDKNLMQEIGYRIPYSYKGKFVFI